MKATINDYQHLAEQIIGYTILLFDDTGTIPDWNKSVE